jgi:MATE family multidrug resistance protein
MFVLWWNIEGILLRLGQGENAVWDVADLSGAEVAALAQQYLRWLSIGIPGYGGTILLKK